MAKRKNRKNKNSHQIAHIKAQRGLDRARFLEENGDMKQWRPPRIVIPDKRKARARRACRGRWNG